MKLLRLALVSLTTAFTINLYCQETKVIAHRGYWDTPNNAQNSITALKKAQEINAYGSEFDVNMTLDGIMIVSHGPKLDFIPEVQKTTYKEVKKVRLKNGERVPTLKQYLKAGKKSDTKLVFELKTHYNREVEREAVEKSAAIIKRLKLEDKIIFISFSLEACKDFVSLFPNNKVQYLSGDLSPAEIKKLGINGIDYNYSIFKRHPEWVIEAKELGIETNVWTVNKREALQEMINLKVNYITTDAPELAKELIK